MLAEILIPVSYLLLKYATIRLHSHVTTQSRKKLQSISDVDR